MHGTGRNNDDRHTLARGKPGVGEPLPFQANAREELATPGVAQGLNFDGSYRNRLRRRGKAGFGILLPVQDFDFVHSVLLSTHREVQQKPASTGRDCRWRNFESFRSPTSTRFTRTWSRPPCFSEPVGKAAATGNLFPMLPYLTRVGTAPFNLWGPVGIGKRRSRQGHQKDIRPRFSGFSRGRPEGQI